MRARLSQASAEREYDGHRDWAGGDGTGVPGQADHLLQLRVAQGGGAQEHRRQ